MTDVKGTTDKPDASKAKAKKDSKIHKYWSMTAPDHMILVAALDADEGSSPESYVRFKDYTLELDISDKREKRLSDGLLASGRVGRDIFRVGEAYEDNSAASSPERVEFWKRMREMAEERDGRARVVALFTNKELQEAGLPPDRADIDQLIMLALETKSLKGVE